MSTDSKVCEWVAEVMSSWAKGHHCLHACTASACAAAAVSDGRHPCAHRRCAEVMGALAALQEESPSQYWQLMQDDAGEETDL